MGNLRRRYLVVALALVGACALPSADEFASGSATSTRDAGGASDSGHPSDARASSTTDSGPVVAPPQDAGDDASPPIVNLLAPESADFETPCSTDNNGGYLASLGPSKAEHSGLHSCKVCRAPDQPNADIWSIDNGLSTTPMPGQEYRATAWVRRPSGSTDAIKVSLALRTHTESYDQVEWQSSDAVTLTDEWQQLSVTLALTQPAPRMDTYTWASNQPDLTTPCFLVDDYVVWRTK